MIKQYYILVLIFIATLNSWCQDTTRILFIGNSFTYFNNMPQMVKAFADSAKVPVVIGMHAPGGVSVGDTAQGTMAHMNNPVLYALIKSKKWDVAVIQDNQGRFVRDSAQFPAASIVVQGHLMLMDSIRYNNPCAKVVLFAGWGPKNGFPPYGNTGIETIQRILRNYVVINDTMKEVISPIGEAWIKAINFLPTVDLWSSDQTHPSNEGSYLTASVVYASIFNQSIKNNTHLAGIAASNAYALRAFADTVVFNSVLRVKYNLKGMTKLTISNVNNILSVAGNHASYKWYKNNQLVGNSSSYLYSSGGTYYAVVMETDNSYIKTCNYVQTITSIIQEVNLAGLRIYPNPLYGTVFNVEFESDVTIKSVKMFDIAGNEMPVEYLHANTGIICYVKKAAAGCYIIRLNSDQGFITKRIILLSEVNQN